jgi:cysteine desulfurase / selenocysteine lyase
MKPQEPTPALTPIASDQFGVGGAMRPGHAPCHAGCPGLARDRFPILTEATGERPLVYLDSAATAQKPLAVIEAEARFYRQKNANVHRGIHRLGDEATRAYEACRERVARFVDAPADAQVVITSGTTASLNLVARGIEHTLLPGDEVLLTEAEHHANLVPWQMLARRAGVTLRHLPVTRAGALDLAALPRLLGPRTRVVSLALASNVLGTINPVAEIAAAARAVGALTVVDAAQAVGHLPVSMEALGVDLLAFSAHKVYGPTGLGFLVGRGQALERLEPTEGGGAMIDRVTLHESTWAELPQRLEAGTPNIAAAAAFPAALDLLDELGMRRVREHEIELVGRMLEGLAGLGGLTLYGPPDPRARVGLVSFTDAKIHAHDLALLLDEQGVAVRAGHHCAQPLHQRLGVAASARASLGVYNHRDDVDALIDAIRTARFVLG